MLVNESCAGEGPEQVSGNNVGDITNVNIDLHLELDNKMTLVNAILGILNKQDFAKEDLSKELSKLPAELDNLPELPENPETIVPKALWKFKKML